MLAINILNSPWPILIVIINFSVSVVEFQTVRGDGGRRIIHKSKRNIGRFQNFILRQKRLKNENPTLLVY